MIFFFSSSHDRFSRCEILFLCLSRQKPILPPPSSIVLLERTHQDWIDIITIKKIRHWGAISTTSSRGNTSGRVNKTHPKNTSEDIRPAEKVALYFESVRIRIVMCNCDRIIFPFTCLSPSLTRFCKLHILGDSFLNDTISFLFHFYREKFIFIRTR